MADLDRLDADLTRPLYTRGEVAALVGLPLATLHGWAHQRSYRGADGSARSSVPLVTTTSGTDTGGTVPFLGLAEAYVIRVFAAAGVSVAGLRPAMSYLARELHPISPLTAQALQTDGPVVLAHHHDPGVFAPLLDLDGTAARFRSEVEDHLSRLTYRDCRVATLELPRRGPSIIVDPRRNAGRPTLAAGGAPLTVVLDRLAAGEAAEAVARDLGLAVADVRALGG